MQSDVDKQNISDASRVSKLPCMILVSWDLCSRLIFQDRIRNRLVLGETQSFRREDLIPAPASPQDKQLPSKDRNEP